MLFRLNGSQPLQHSKATIEGATMRRDLLMRADYPGDMFDRVSLRKGDAREDDVIDAFAAASVASDIYCGKAMRMPDSPEIDSKGLRMEIWG